MKKTGGMVNNQFELKLLFFPGEHTIVNQFLYLSLEGINALALIEALLYDNIFVEVEWVLEVGVEVGDYVRLVYLYLEVSQFIYLLAYFVVFAVQQLEGLGVVFAFEVAFEGSLL